MVWHIRVHGCLDTSTCAHAWPSMREPKGAHAWPRMREPAGERGGGLVDHARVRALGEHEGEHVDVAVDDHLGTCVWMCVCCIMWLCMADSALQNHLGPHQSMHRTDGALGACRVGVPSHQVVEGRFREALVPPLVAEALARAPDGLRHRISAAQPGLPPPPPPPPTKASPYLHMTPICPRADT